MNDLSSSLILKSDNESKEKILLLKTLSKKRKILMAITAKVEMLRMDLDIVKREYDVRIGKLYLKDDQLDLEIIRYHRIKTLLEEGYSYEKALEAINKIYEQDRINFDMKSEEILQEEIDVAKRKKVDSYKENDIKKIWKKLLFQLHPDLTINEEEKRKREQVMKKINDAYAENDYDTLKQLEQLHYVESPDESSIQSIEQKIVEIENAIIFFENEYQNLLASEWYMWKKKSDHAKRKNLDLFKELEEKLLEDLTRKIKIVHKLREEFDNKGYY